MRSERLPIRLKSPIFEVLSLNPRFQPTAINHALVPSRRIPKGTLDPRSAGKENRMVEVEMVGRSTGKMESG
jgi:hypothetical protein